MMRSKSKKNALDFVYERNENFTWHREREGVVIDVKNTGAFNRIAQTVFKKPKTSHIALDKYGSLFWENLDGEKSVYDIYLLMVNAFSEEKDTMLERVVKFTKILSDNRYIKRIK